MQKTRYLTKSRFKLAMECPTKLFYTGKDAYANQQLADSFLLALADGGFQVGELAKHYFPNGHEIDTLDYQQALTETNNLLELDNVIIYEATIATEKLFIRVDILVKQGNHLSLYEVKAKSFNPQTDSFTNNKGEVIKKWQTYLYDVAFQKYVINQALPQYEVSAYLMLADKTAKCPTDGLNQKFQLIKNSNKLKSVVVANNLTATDLTPEILCKINVDKEITKIYSTTVNHNDQPISFKEQVDILADHYIADIKICSPIAKKCASCEFHTTSEDQKAKLKSGKKECWQQQLGWSDDDCDKPTVLDIWNFRKKDNLIKENRIKMLDVSKHDINPQPDKNKNGLSISERQWLQVEKYQNNDKSIWLDKKNLQHEMNNWVYPLHFIDFETTKVAIPFNAERYPYELVAFQFSHHIVYKDGTIEHFGEYLNTKQGTFPNYDFVRKLKAQLENDNGSIFRYALHENTVLNEIYNQLQNEQTEIADRVELCDFIKSITTSSKKSTGKWIGNRNMVDMLEIVKSHYYDPATNGANSIKQILPAMLNSSKYLQNKYSKAIYGATNGIKSSNFKDIIWIKTENGKIINPYEMLPQMFKDISENDMRLLSTDNELKDGGAAMTAYARMQFDQISDSERNQIRTALLKYCELDTLAMVMIYEGWKNFL